MVAQCALIGGHRLARAQFLGHGRSFLPVNLSLYLYQLPEAASFTTTRAAVFSIPALARMEA